MNYEEGQRRLSGLRDQIARVRAEMRKIRADLEPQPVRDYVFQSVEGERRLSELFGRNEYLFMVHNMGASCPYCTLWADGYNGIYDHLTSRAAFVISSPDPPQVQQQFAASRGWKFPMVSHRGTTFAADMGFRSPYRGWLPGVSVFCNREGTLVRVSEAEANAGDDFCSLWHLLDMLPQGIDGWRPRLDYQEMPRAKQPCCR